MATNISTLSVSRPLSGGLRRFWLLVQANALMYIRDKAGVFWVILFPILLMLVFGAIWGNVRLGPNDTLSFISFLAPGLIVLSLMSNGLVGNAETMATYRQRGILRRIQATPLPVWQLILSRVIMQSGLMLGQTFLMIATSVVVFNARYDWWGLAAALPFVVLGAVLFMAMGQVIAALVRRPETASVVASAVNFPLMFLGGLWTPIEQMPDWLQGISKLLPSAMVSDLLRAPMLANLNIETNLPFMVSLAGVLVYLVVSVVVAARFFKWD